MMMVELVSIKCDDMEMVAFTHDFGAAGKLSFNLSFSRILKFGYFPEPTKSWLITDFKDNKVKIKNSRKRFLGPVIGAYTFKKQYVDKIVSQYISKIEVLSQIAKAEPQAAYCCLRTGFKHNVTYLICTTLKINEELKRLDDAINNKITPSFTVNKLCRNNEFQNSSLLAKERVSIVTQQERTCGIQKETINKIKKKIRRDRQEYNQQKLMDIESRLSR